MQLTVPRLLLGAAQEGYSSTMVPAEYDPEATIVAASPSGIKKAVAEGIAESPMLKETRDAAVNGFKVGVESLQQRNPRPKQYTPVPVSGVTAWQAAGARDLDHALSLALRLVSSSSCIPLPTITATAPATAPATAANVHAGACGASCHRVALLHSAAQASVQRIQQRLKRDERVDRRKAHVKRVRPCVCNQSGLPKER